MDLDLAGKVVALTGASHGVGFAIARHLVAEGAAVAIAARSAQELAEAHAVIESQGGRCLAYACDLAVPGESAAFIASAVEIYGRLDGLVCNGAMALAGEGTHEAWEAALALNVGHAAEAIEAAAPSMHASGSILLLGPGKGEEEAWPVAALRGGLAEAARHFSQDLGRRGLRVNQLLVGGDAMADVAAFLLSERSADIKGATLPR